MSAAGAALDGDQRGRAYWLLAKLYAEQLDADTIDRLAAAAADESGEGFAAQLLHAFRDGTGGDALVRRLAVEHTRLFRAIQEGYGPPPPYESLWREGCLMGESTVGVATSYLEAGYEPDGRFSPCDHIVEELRFMASLCHAEHHAWRGGQTPQAREWFETQARFLERHLGAWVKTYCGALAEQAREPVYRALARVTENLVEQDALHTRSAL